jgi:hypothetical protein
MRPYRPRDHTIWTLLHDLDGSTLRPTRSRAWSGITGWRFEPSSAHAAKAPHVGAFVVLGSRGRAGGRTFVATPSGKWRTASSPHDPNLLPERRLRSQRTSRASKLCRQRRAVLGAHTRDLRLHRGRSPSPLATPTRRPASTNTAAMCFPRKAGRGPSAARCSSCLQRRSRPSRGSYSASQSLPHPRREVDVGWATWRSQAQVARSALRSP